VFSQAIHFCLITLFLLRLLCILFSLFCDPFDFLLCGIFFYSVCFSVVMFPSRALLRVGIPPDPFSTPVLHPYFTMKSPIFFLLKSRTPPVLSVLLLVFVFFFFFFWVVFFPPPWFFANALSPKSDRKLAPSVFSLFINHILSLTYVPLFWQWVFLCLPSPSFLYSEPFFSRSVSLFPLYWRDLPHSSFPRDPTIQVLFSRGPVAYICRNPSGDSYFFL